MRLNIPPKNGTLAVLDWQTAALAAAAATDANAGIEINPIHLAINQILIPGPPTLPNSAEGGEASDDESEKLDSAGRRCVSGIHRAPLSEPVVLCVCRLKFWDHRNQAF